VTYTLQSEKPVPIWIVDRNHKPSSNDPPVKALQKRLAGQGDWPTFRGVSIDRLSAVMTTGVDVEPTHAPIYGVGNTARLPARTPVHSRVPLDWDHQFEKTLVIAAYRDTGECKIPS
jgi:hypothetical protein